MSLGSTHSTTTENTFKFEDHVFGIVLKKKLEISMPNNAIIGLPSVTQEFTIILSKDEDKVTIIKKINSDGSTSLDFNSKVNNTMSGGLDGPSFNFIIEWISGVQRHPTQLEGIRKMEASLISHLQIFEHFEHLFKRKEFEGMDDILVGVSPQSLLGMNAQEKMDNDEDGPDSDDSDDKRKGSSYLNMFP